MMLIVVSAGIIVWIALSVGLRPLENLRRSIERRSADDLTPIQFEPPAEVRNVVASMNGLFGELAKANQVRERFIGDAAHQLRNPIAAIKTQSETALLSENLHDYRESLRKILQTTENTGRMVEQLLTSARAHATNPQQARTFAVDEVVREVAENSASMALQKGHEFVYEGEGKSVRIRGYPRLFGEAVANLIDNAIRHTPRGTQITVGIENGRVDGRACVYVADEGPEFSDEEFRRLLEPFATGETESQGNGLGLAVVDDIARMHGGNLVIDSARNGRGKQFSITLPLSTA